METFPSYLAHNTPGSSGLDSLHGALLDFCYMSATAAPTVKSDVLRTNTIQGYFCSMGPRDGYVKY